MEGTEAEEEREIRYRDEEGVSFQDIYQKGTTKEIYTVVYIVYLCPSTHPSLTASTRVCGL